MLLEFRDETEHTVTVAVAVHQPEGPADEEELEEQDTTIGQ